MIIKSIFQLMSYLAQKNIQPYSLSIQQKYMECIDILTTLASYKIDKIWSVMTYVMLLTLKDSDTYGSLWLCHLSYVIHMFYESVYICTSMGLYTVMIYTDAVIADMYLYVLMAASSLGYYWLNVYYIVMCLYCVFLHQLYWNGCVFILVCIILYHYISILMTLWDMASVWLCCALWWCFVFDCL